MGAQIPLVDVPVGVVEVPVLEEDGLGAGLHQILVQEIADALGVHQNDLVLRPGHGDLVLPGHVVELALHLAAAAVEEAPAGDLLPVGPDMGLLHFRHGHGEALQPRRDAQRLAARFQILRRPQLLRCAAAVDIVGILEDLFQGSGVHGQDSFRFFCPHLSTATPDAQRGRAFTKKRCPKS